MKYIMMKRPYDPYPHLITSMLSPSPSPLQGRDKEQEEKMLLPSPLSAFLEHLPDFSNGADNDNDLYDCNAKTALNYYNSLHHTDYKVVRDDGFKCYDHISDPIRSINLVVIHCKFAAKSKRAVDGDSPAKLFFAELRRRNLEKEVVISCRILDGLTTGCCECDDWYHFILDRHLKSSGPCDSYFNLESFMLSPSPNSIQGSDKEKVELPPPSPYLGHPVDFSDCADSDSDSDSYCDSDYDSDEWDDTHAKSAVKYYNSLNRTDYKVVRDKGFKCDEHLYYPNVHRNLSISHCMFAAKSKGADGDSPAKFFLAELYRRNIENEVVISCRILDGPTTGCYDCDHSYHYRLNRPLKSPGQKQKEKAERRNDGTFPNIALAYYNQNHHEDYEFVGDLEASLFLELELAIHCNFRAKRKTGCGYEASLPKLFFAELEKIKDVWKATTCHIIDGSRTLDGCYMCHGRRAKKIQHPTLEFRHGFYNDLTGLTFIEDASKP